MSFTLVIHRILDRISGKTKSDLQFRDDRLVAREATMELIERFAEEQKAAAAAAAESSRAAARREA